MVISQGENNGIIRQRWLEDREEPPLPFTEED